MDAEVTQHCCDRSARGVSVQTVPATLASIALTIVAAGPLGILCYSDPQIEGEWQGWKGRKLGNYRFSNLAGGGVVQSALHP